jgi:hypothetical protein
MSLQDSRFHVEQASAISSVLLQPAATNNSTVGGTPVRVPGGSVSFMVLSQPGSPLALSWTIGSLPLVGLIAFLGIAWRRVRRAANR